MRAARGCVQKLGKEHYKVTVSYTDPTTGNRHRPSKTVRGTARDAENVKLKMLARVDGGEYASALPLSEYIEDFFIPSLEGRKSRTIATAKDRCRLYVTPLLGNEKLSNITPKLIRQWLNTFKVHSKKFVAYTTLRQVLNSAVSAGFLNVSPLDKVDAIKREQYDPEVLDAKDAEVYLWHFKDTEIEAAVLLALGAGMRRGEIIALDVSDINLITGKVRIDDAITQHGPEIYEGDPKSRYGIRDIYLPSMILVRLCEVLGESGAILVEDNERMRPDRLTAHYTRIMNKMPEGVPRIPLKNLRHTSLTLAYDGGADILTVSRRAGHSNTQVTTDYYVRPKGSRDREAAVAIDSALTTKKRQMRDTPRPFVTVEEF